MNHHIGQKKYCNLCDWFPYFLFFFLLSIEPVCCRWLFFEASCKFHLIFEQREDKIVDFATWNGSKFQSNNLWTKLLSAFINHRYFKIHFFCLQRSVHFLTEKSWPIMVLHYDNSVILRLSHEFSSCFPFPVRTREH